VVKKRKRKIEREGDDKEEVVTIKEMKNLK
jgi:hypothetical protein